MTTDKKLSCARPLRSLSLGGGPTCFLFIICASLLTACSGQTSSGQLTTELQTVSSWAASARKVAEDWMSNRVPTAYAKRSLQTAQDELEDETKTLSRAASTAQGAKALEQIERLRGIIEQMQEGLIEQADRAALAGPVGQLSEQEQAINALKAESAATPPTP